MRATLVVIASLVAGPAFAADGAAVWKAQCAKCHGETGKADTPIAKSLKVPAIAGDAKIAAMSADELLKVFKANAKHSVVKAPEDDVKAAAAHAKELAGAK